MLSHIRLEVSVVDSPSKTGSEGSDPNGITRSDGHAGVEIFCPEGAWGVIQYIYVGI